MNCMAYTNYDMLMANFMSALDCIIHYNYYTSARFCHVSIQVNQDDVMLRLIGMVLGCDLPVQLLLNSLSSPYDHRLVDRFHYVLIYVTKTFYT